ncbi:MAG TPA: glycine cleavage T C-terminal barrel domain-containing protein [Armatimonadota bacterium]|jgi:folate-binding protein YgfZ
MTQHRVPSGYEAIRTGAAFHQPEGGRFRLMGPEAKEYLHRMVTNDIRSLAPGQGTYACLLEIDGRMIADLWAWVVSEEEVLVETAAPACDALMATLDKYLIMEEVEIQDARGDEALVTVQGPTAHQALANALAIDLPPLERGSLWQTSDDGAGLIAAARDRTGHGGLDVYMPGGADRLIEALRETGVPEASAEAMDVLRIEAGLAAWGAELTNATIPLEANLEGAAVSFTKGCYPGQEIIARIHSRGKPARRLVGIRFQDGPPPAGCPVHAGDAAIGAITSSAESPAFGPIAMAYLKKEHGEPGVSVTAGEHSGITLELPFR